MSAVTRPRGPLPPRVYWTRRLLLLAIVLLVGWLFLRWIGGGDSGAAPSDGGDATVAASDDGDAARTDPHHGKSRDRARTDQVQPVAETFDRPHKNCDLTHVLVTPTVAVPAYAGEPATVTLRVSTSSSTACSLSIDAEHLLLSITSGDDTVWDSTHCEDAIRATDITLQPRWSTLVDVVWSGQYSGRHCRSNADAAKPGTYTVAAAVLEGEPTETDFELVQRPDPVDHDNDKGDDKGKNDNSDKGNSDDEPTDTATPDDQPSDTATTDDSGTNT